MIIADTGFWVAIFDKNDQYHQQAKHRLKTLNEPFISTLPVLTEVCYLLQTRCHAKKATDFLLAQQEGLVSLFAIKTEHLVKMTKLMIQYANLPMDFADASLVLLAEELGHGRIVSTDQRDFHAYRWKNHHPFTNLLLPQ
jgi:predicted nucleic acid-binding protein